MDQQPAKKSSINFLQVIIAVIIVAVLAGMIIPIFGVIRQISHHPQCGLNQSHILGAMVAYNTNEGLDTWVGSIANLDTSIPAAVRGRLITTKFWECVAADLSIPNALFKCYYSRSLAPTSKPRPSDPTSTWGKEDGRVIGYALDWAASVDPSSERPMIADRDVDAHKGGVMVAFGDAHVKKLKLIPVQREAGALLTEALMVSPLTVGTGNQPDDDIYSSEGDAGDSLTPGKGDPLRAWVK
jgi:prepilin-type processing-associated H-X9-DG protein